MWQNTIFINRMFNTHHILTGKKLFSLLHDRRISQYHFSNINLLQLKSSWKKNNSSNLPESSLSFSLLETAHVKR